METKEEKNIIQHQCDHFFIVGEKKTTASCLSTHEAFCEKCGINLHKHLIKIYREYFGNYQRIKINDETDKINDEIATHVHCWDQEDVDKYKCVTRITDWKKTKKKNNNITYGKICGEILYKKSIK